MSDSDMTKADVIDTCNDIYTKIDNLVAMLESILEDARTLKDRAENLPTDDTHIADDPNEEDDIKKKGDYGDTKSFEDKL